MININSITFSIQGIPLLKDASAFIPKGHKIGIVGRNGSGKTSLFRLLKNEWQIDDGAIELPSNYKIGSVDQEAPSSNISLIETVLSHDKERATLLKESLQKLEPDRIAEIQIRLNDIDAFSAEARASKILSGLGFNEFDQKRNCSEFSGGWRMRIALGSVLFSHPDILLLDEPTNYLDLEGTVWLESFLTKYPATVLIISHDRDLLNNSVNGILHLNNLKLTYYRGNFDQFEKELSNKIQLQQTMIKKQDAEKKHIKNFVDRFRYKASKARQAQSRLKKLEKMEKVTNLSVNPVLPFNFPNPKELPSPLITIEKGAIGYNKKVILSNINIFVGNDDRIALLGVNGQGKSSLSKVLAGRLDLIKGKLIKSRNLKIGYFSQHQLDELTPDLNSIEHLVRLKPDQTITQIRSELGSFGIGEDIAENPVETLSGGQKARLLLSLATIDNPHLIILDEPTNHLDIETRAVLAHALNKFQGAIILVSHDVFLIEMIADRLLLLQDGVVLNFEEDIRDYIKSLLSKDVKINKKGKIKKKAKEKKNTNKFSRSKLYSQIKNCEKTILKLETEKEQIEIKMTKPDFYLARNTQMIKELSDELRNINNDLEKQEALWFDLQSKL